MRGWARTLAERTQEKEKGGKLRRAGARAEFRAEVKRGDKKSSHLGTGIQKPKDYSSSPPVDQVESSGKRIGKKGPLLRSYTTEMRCSKIV